MRLLVYLGLCTLLVAASAAEIKVRYYKGGHPYVRYDPTTMVLGLSPSEAERRLLEWMNTPGLQIRLIGVTAHNLGMLRDPASWPLYAPHWSPGDELSYLFEDNFGKLYIVGIVPIHLWRYIDPDAENSLLYPEGESSSEWLPRDQLRTIALQFLQQRVPNFLALPNEIEGYSHLAIHVVHQGLLHNRMAIIRVHKRLGVVTECHWRDPGEPVGLSTVPALSQQQACQLALEFISQMPRVISVRVDESPPYHVGLGVFTDEMGTSRLLWGIPVSAELDTGSPEIHAGQGYLVAVDAHTGDVFLFEEMLGAMAGGKVQRGSERSRPKRTELRVMKIYFGDLDVSKLLMPPPLQIEGAVYLWVGWLRSPMFGVPAARVAYDPALREVSVVFQGKRWRFSAGSNKVFSDNGEIVLPHPVRNIRARIYLPLSVIERMTGWRGQVSEDRLVLSSKR
ncbi:MAG: hypothetical protein KatS3mg022_3243 [Armatimonadota bacterium]|nr:MAG: hypothetical protein KatS3mg022_3243 [Armatimonadota bacterium]